MYHILLGLLTIGLANGQQQGDVRLINGSSAWNGLLEVYNAGSWRFVCDDFFGFTNSRVVCRQLGYYPPNPLSPVCCQPADPPQYWLDNVRCRGIESRISHCRHNGWGNHNCGGREAVNVRCNYRDPCASNPCPAGNTCRRLNNVRYECSDPNPERSAPLHRFASNQLFLSSTGASFSEECTAGLLGELEIRANEMLGNLQDRLGSSVCNGVTGMTAPLVGSSLATANHRGVVILEYFLQGHNNHTWNHFYQCGEDAHNYINNFGNWRQPILPAPPGCPGVNWIQNNFRNAGRDWFC